MTQKPCEFCGTATNTDTTLAGLVICQSCLIAEVEAFKMYGEEAIQAVLNISPVGLSK